MSGELELSVAGRVDETVGAVGTLGVQALTMLAFGHDGAAAAALAGTMSGPWIEQTSQLIRNAFSRRMGRAQRAVEIAAGTAHWSAQELMEAAFRDDKCIELATRALTAAAASATDERIDALGRALATGLIAADAAKIDEQLLVVNALADMEAPDVRLLLLMNQPGENGRPGSWHRSKILETAPDLALVVDALLARLSRLGLISDTMPANTVFGNPTWWVTDFGRLCLSTLAVRGQTGSSECQNRSG